MKILSFDCHESLLTAWAMLGHEIHLLPYKKEWAWNVLKRPVPENVKLLPEGFVPDYKTYNLGVAFNEHTQLPQVRAWGIPYICSFASLANIRDKDKLAGEKLFFCGHEQKRYYQGKYGANIQGEVIYYPVDLDEFSGYVGDNCRILSTINYFGQACNRVPRGYDWAYKITSGLGYDNWGWSLETGPVQFPKPKDYLHLKDLYKFYAVYLDPVIASPMSMSNIEAMATGMPLVTRPHDDWTQIIENGHNGIISFCDDIIRSEMKWLMSDADYRKKIGEHGRETIRDLFSVELWKEKWNKVFSEMGLI